MKSAEADLMQQGEAIDAGVLLQVRNLSKCFPGVKALDGVHLDIERGKVHALVGANGAGKSTLMNVLTGIHQPDGGHILLNGRPVRMRSPHDALRMGIAMVHQELMPFPDLTVAENIFMGQQPVWRPLGWIDTRAMQRQAEGLLAKIGAALSPEARMRDLSVAQMQVVEIARALVHKVQLIIMDEPTSAITDHEAGRLFAIIRDLRRQGVAVVYISHRLDEIYQIADTVTVLRDGRHVTTRDVSQFNKNEVISLMAGRDLEYAAERPASTHGEVALAVEDLSGPGFSDITFEVRRGEIVGIAGLMGAGKTELVGAIGGLGRYDSGRVVAGGRAVAIRRPADAIACGMGMVTEDRRKYGLVPCMGLDQNITLSALRRCCTGPFIRRLRRNRMADNAILAFNIRTPNRSQPVEHLSGGNQQKAVMARLLLTEPDILILDEPTRGIDVHARAEIHRMLRRLTGEGKAIIMVSSEASELLATCDRILVLCEGRITARLAADRTSQEEIMRYAFPHERGGGG